MTERIFFSFSLRLRASRARDQNDKRAEKLSESIAAT
jgi:hypothetical protein